MKYLIGILTIATLTASFALSGCNSSSEKMDAAELAVIEANRDYEIAKSKVEAELVIYRAKNADRIMEYNRSIAEIKQKINNESDRSVRNSLETKLDGYEETHRQLKREIDNYKASGKESWDAFEDSFSSRMDELGTALENFFASPDTKTSSN